MNSETSVKIEVLFFAKAREITGLADLSLQVPPCCSAGDCLKILLNKFPGLEEIRNSMVFSVNEEYAAESTILKNGDELAIIPPISDFSTENNHGKVSEEQNPAGVAGMNSETSVKIEVLFFAKAREITGLADLSLQVPPCCSAGDCLKILLNKFPGLEKIYNSMVFAVNEEYAPESTILKNGDELAIIPPISGG
ncbi:uncharacterized protein LOC110019997 [Phalaenopsis equestris]|uniref:uncharacterized protein LOC110019997 n=1 Tax=Phalaenopsis equestris TaxID=78828 RepID=UPI0009E37D41|nr:uncharacterized protein LOC110019997 [Phalaenopsis equestris]